MILHKAPLFHVYFGDSRDCLMPDWYQNLPDTPIEPLEPFASAKNLMRLDSLFFLRQVHGTAGMALSKSSVLPSFKSDGDYLITNAPRIGLGIMTADCLPIIIHDRVRNVVGIAHAGWRGSVQNIAGVMLRNMESEYGTEIENIKVFFGACAKMCCYVVDEAFLSNITKFEGYEATIQQRDDGLYFDLPGFNRIQLESLGIKKEAINIEYNACTICSERYCSVRRQKGAACRQMTIVSLT